MTSKRWKMEMNVVGGKKIKINKKRARRTGASGAAEEALYE